MGRRRGRRGAYCLNCQCTGHRTEDCYFEQFYIPRPAPEPGYAQGAVPAQAPALAPASATAPAAIGTLEYRTPGLVYTLSYTPGPASAPVPVPVTAPPGKAAPLQLARIAMASLVAFLYVGTPAPAPGPAAFHVVLPPPVVCGMCGEVGHVGLSCPQMVMCQLCGQAGHVAPSCPQIRAGPATSQATKVVGQGFIVGEVADAGHANANSRSYAANVAGRGERLMRARSERGRPTTIRDRSRSPTRDHRPARPRFPVRLRARSRPAAGLWSLPPALRQYTDGLTTYSNDKIPPAHDHCTHSQGLHPEAAESHRHQNCDRLNSKERQDGRRRTTQHSEINGRQTGGGNAGDGRAVKNKPAEDGRVKKEHEED